MTDTIGTEGTPVVLIVDDERELADTYSFWLREDYEVRTAYSGEEALDELSRAVDVVLLDRRMPDVPGDKVLERVRDEGHDCRVSMLTAVEPEMDIIDLYFDEYLVKPVTEEEVRRTVDDLVLRGELDDDLREYLSRCATLAALESNDVEGETVEELRDDVDACREEADRTLESMDFEQAFREINH